MIREEKWPVSTGHGSNKIARMQPSSRSMFAHLQSDAVPLTPAGAIFFSSREGNLNKESGWRANEARSSGRDRAQARC